MRALAGSVVEITGAIDASSDRRQEALVHELTTMVQQQLQNVQQMSEASQAEAVRLSEERIKEEVRSLEEHLRPAVSGIESTMQQHHLQHVECLPRLIGNALSGDLDRVETSITTALAQVQLQLSTNNQTQHNTDLIALKNELLQHFERLLGTSLTDLESRLNVASQVTGQDLTARLESIHQTAETTQHQLQIVQQATMGLLQDEHSCPCFPFLLRESIKYTTSNWRKVIGHWTKPANLTKQNWRLFMVDPITLSPANTNDGKGYKIKVTKSWVKEHQLALSVGLVLVQASFTAASMAIGVPGAIANSSGVAQLLHATEEAQALFDHYELNPGQLACDLSQAAGVNFNSSASAAAAEDHHGLSASTTGAEGALYRQLNVLFNEVDAARANTGLVKSCCPAQGTAMWVLPEHADRYQRQGNDCLHPHVRAWLDEQSGVQVIV